VLETNRVDLPGTTPGYDQAEKLVHDLVRQAIDAAVEAAKSALPFLNAPIIRGIFKLVVNKFSELIYKNIETAVALAVITARVDGEQRAYERALEAVKDAVSRPSGGMTDEEKKKLLDEYDARLRDLIRFPSRRMQKR